MATPDGTIYWSEIANLGDPGGAQDRIRKRSPDGRVFTLAADENGVPGAPAPEGHFRSALSLALTSQGLLLSNTADGGIRRISPALAGYSGGVFRLGSSDGSQIFAFDSSGRQLSTLDAGGELPAS